MQWRSWPSLVIFHLQYAEAVVVQGEVKSTGTAPAAPPASSSTIDLAFLRKYPPWGMNSQTKADYSPFRYVALAPPPGPSRHIRRTPEWLPRRASPKGGAAPQCKKEALHEPTRPDGEPQTTPRTIRTLFRWNLGKNGGQVRAHALCPAATPVVHERGDHDQHDREPEVQA